MESSARVSMSNMFGIVAKVHTKRQRPSSISREQLVSTLLRGPLPPLALRGRGQVELALDEFTEKTTESKYKVTMWARRWGSCSASVRKTKTSRPERDRGEKIMYAEAGFQFPFLPSALATEPASRRHCPSSTSTSDEDLIALFQQDCGTQLINMLQTPVVSGYDLGGEGDLFKAPEPITEEPEMALDPLVAAMSIMSGGEDAITETIKVADIESIQNDHLSDVFYDCKKDLLEKSMIEEPISELLDVKIPAVPADDGPIDEKPDHAEEAMQKSVSNGCLKSMDGINDYPVRRSFLDFEGLDFETAFGMRRAYSEGDIQNLCNKSINMVPPSTAQPAFEQLLTINGVKTEERRQKLSRYWKKKSQRNFGRKIKYACRKALADSQPRVRGRFAKTEDSDASKKSNRS